MFNISYQSWYLPFFLHVSLFVYLLHWAACTGRWNGRRWGGANTDMISCVFLSWQIGARGAVLLALIVALYCAMLQDYYINLSDLITLGMREKKMEHFLAQIIVLAFLLSWFIWRHCRQIQELWEVCWLHWQMVFYFLKREGNFSGWWFMLCFCLQWLWQATLPLESLGFLVWTHCLDCLKMTCLCSLKQWKFFQDQLEMQFLR